MLLCKVFIYTQLQKSSPSRGKQLWVAAGRFALHLALDNRAVDSALGAEITELGALVAGVTVDLGLGVAPLHFLAELGAGVRGPDLI